MTYGELRQAVLHLGISQSFDDAVLEASLPDAASRALTEVSRLRPRTVRTTLSHFPILPTCEPVSFTHTDGEVRIEAVGAASFCFYISGGEGKLTVKRGSETRELNINGAPRSFVAYSVRDLFSTSTVKNDIELIFSGDYFYYITELCFYSVLRADGVISPAAAGSVFDMNDLVGDFSRFCAPFVTREGEDFDYFCEGSKVILPPDAPNGDYTVFYEHMPTRLTEDTPDTEELDCDRDLTDLLPLITAYYVWIDDEPEKAAAYYQRYAEQAALVREKRVARTPRTFESTNNW